MNRNDQEMADSFLPSPYKQMTVDETTKWIGTLNEWEFRSLLFPRDSLEWADNSYCCHRLKCILMDQGTPTPKLLN